MAVWLGCRVLYCGIAALLIVAFSFVAPLLCQHDAELANLALSNRAPDGEFLMGTDSLGRCILCRVLTGLHTTVLAALAVVALSVVIGSVLGALSGYVGGVFDSVIMRITDAFMAFPTLVLGIAIAGLLGGGLQNAVIALVVPDWDALCAHCSFVGVGVERAPLHPSGSYRRSKQNGNCPETCAAQHSSTPDRHGVFGHRWLDAQFGGTFVFGFGLHRLPLPSWAP